jgi:cystathionine beta-lyase/cystathionine gamma-synthase
MLQGEGSSMMSSRDQEGSRNCVSDNHGQRLLRRENPLVFGNLASWTVEDTSPMQSATLVPVMRCVSMGYSSIGGVALRRSNRFRNNESNLHGFREQIAEPRNTEACASLALGVAAIKASVPTLPKKGSKAVGIVDTHGAAPKLFLAILTRRRVDVVLRG